MKQQVRKFLYHTRTGMILLGIVSFIWLIVRSGRKPSRFQYPCQRAAAGHSMWLGGYLFAGTGSFFSKWRHRHSSKKSIIETTISYRRLLGAAIFGFAVWLLLSTITPGLTNNTTAFLQPFDATPSPFAVDLTNLGVDPETIPPATVSIVSSLNPTLAFPMPLDAHLSYAQVHDLVWTALDQDTSTYSLINTIQPNDWIVLKPNIVAAPIKTKNGSRWTSYWYNNIPHPGQVTDLRVVKSIIEYLAVHTSPRRITIAEGGSEWGKLGETGTSSAVINDGWTVQWPDFGNLSYIEIVNSINSTYPNLVDIVDLSYDAYRTVPVPDPHGSGIGGLYWDEYAMPATLLDCDRWIDMPVLKTHFIAGVSLAHKSRIGSIANQAYNDSPNSQYSVLHEQGNDGIRRCLVDLMSLRPADYVITEGLWGTAGNGPQWGENVQHNVIIASHDPVAADAAGAVIMGFNPWDIEYLHWSSQKGFGTLDFEKITFSAEKPIDLRRDFGKSSGYSATKIPYWGRANRNWLLNGWYGGTNLNRNYLESETDIFPTDGAQDDSKSWQQYSSSSDRVDLRSVLGKYVTNCISYAFTYVNATSALNCNLVVGADDGIKIWVNSELVLSDKDGNSFEPAEFQIPIHLNAGQNTILCKIVNYDSDWEFSLNICDADGDTPLEIHYSVEPEALTPDPTLPIPAPELISPKSTFMTDNRYPIFSWQTPDITNKLAQDWHFLIDFSKSPDFSSPEIQIDSRENSMGFMPAMPLYSADATVRFQMQQPLTDGDWWWRVRAWDGTKFSEITPGRKLTIDTKPPRILDISAQQIQLFSRWQGPVPTSKLAIQLTYSEEYADKAIIELIGAHQKPLSLKLASGQKKHLTTSMAMMGIIGNYSLVKATLYDSLGHQAVDSVRVTLGWIRQLGGFAQSPDTVVDGSFTVSWETVNSASQDVAKFDVKYKMDDGPWQLWLEKYPAYSAEFQNAIPGHRYQFEAAAWENNGKREEFSGIAESQTIVLSETSTPLPLDFQLSANYPNPFNSATQFEFSLPQAERVSILIFNATGKLVQTLFQNHRFEAGQHQFSWDSATKNGAAPSGVYFCRFQAGSFTTIRRMTLVK